MSKKFMHIMIDDVMSNEELEKLYDNLNNLNSDYDIAISSSKVQIAVYDQELIKEINEKLDIILENMSQLNTMRTDIRNDIKYVFGLTNNQRRRY